MAALNIEEIKKDATDRLDVAKKHDELQALVNRVYPGYMVVLHKNGTIASVDSVRSRTRYNFTDLTQTGQIEAILKPGPMELSKLLAELQARGSSVSRQSLMSLLSAGKRTGKFNNAARGMWGLSQDVGTHILEESK